MTAAVGRKNWPGPDLMIAEVIGSPIAHSRSPEIHLQWIRALGLNAMFGACEVGASELPHWLEQRRIGKTWRGCSVTAPLKQVAAGLVDSLTRDARRLRAVNFICSDGRRLKGHNTDLDGIRVALAPHLRRTGMIVIAGAGGATAAALAYAIDQGFEDINVVARDPERVFGNLGSRFAARFRIVPFERAPQAIKGAEVLVNATPMGSSYGAPLRRDILDALASAASGAVVLDMNYAPVETILLKSAARAGLVPVSGLEMLIGQARRAFELLFGHTPPGKTTMATDPSPSFRVGR